MCDDYVTAGDWTGRRRRRVTPPVVTRNGGVCVDTGRVRGARNNGNRRVPGVYAEQRRTQDFFS